MKTFLMMGMVACGLAALAVPDGAALAQQPADPAMAAQIRQIGQSARQVVVSGAPGWECRGEVPPAPGRGNRASGGGGRGGSGGGGGFSGRGGRDRSDGAVQQTIWLKCSDRSRASARLKRDALRREWVILFSHKTHGRAELRVRD